ncbi:MULTISPECIES: type II toxin-antitoxin system HicB family antitoxin [unclassified Microcystis]|jgi:predicted RNase H-like HicB family nuclease|uniref:type II toxin-antitoxin system HicB family antitoxin n=1 Tax=unclassified Microcystis TaxID=2643300 RepID=UPI00118F10D4|nr:MULTISPECIES: type II toxin-antitoxin system HicB family antitoxin [unclassified Microcystis]MCA2928113.1 type II toxin-antitoxin system HicB family antitoxin [Microcystis sp. M020S1]MCA2937108.1 type II toxin-antitoxin system HicB family antitoxin [Microcystis sp. M015S1]NCR20690.1 type II toxin-antitoxin system HicB family antitoxin [Microcystis aeruginosa L111-01]NCS42426.1 type II toxin-antitoxin system HicB family antitoxin [Microcystis aeruginosa BS11-05]NCS51013.1 type II toxin-antit
MKVNVILEPSEEGDYNLSVPSLPGCISEGHNLEKALSNIQEGMELCLELEEKERRIAEGTYTISDFNQKTQQAIQNIEEQKTLTVVKDQVELYQQLGIYR